MMRLACCFAAVMTHFFISMNSSAFGSTCGSWEHNDRESEFAGEPFGTVGFVRGSHYFVLPRGRCINLTDTSGMLKFAINHNGAVDSQPTFASIHVALVKIGGNDPQQQYLFRNAGNWVKDRSGIQYSSNHLVPHSEFDSGLQGGQPEFDSRYRDDVGRTWSDGVATETSPPLSFQSWSYRSTFSTKAELLEAVARKQISLKAQNYLVSFKSRAVVAGGSAGTLPGFTFNAGGYDCAFIRVSGTSNQPDMAGEYMLNLRSGSQCENVISGFTSLGSLFDILPWRWR
ncbi:hypothetical protein [Tardiphaga sp.]|uniref:hypothetical protein n=1 Tax=Tardiphaga sp. TaxID=1926292 RepID=UPI00352A2722